MSFYDFICLTRRYSYKELSKIIDMKNNNVNNNIILKKTTLTNDELIILENIIKIYKKDLIKLIKHIKKDYLIIDN